MRKLHNELNEKVSEIKHMQLESTRQEDEEARDAVDSSKRLIETLEKENTALKVCRFIIYALLHSIVIQKIQKISTMLSIKTKLDNSYFF